MPTVEVRTKNMDPKYSKLTESIYVFIFESTGIFYDKKITCFMLLNYHKVFAIMCNDFFKKKNMYFTLSIAHLKILIIL